MLERRARGTRCPECGHARVERTVSGTRIDLTCVRCGYQWLERRKHSTLGPWTPPPDDVVHRAVAEICAARDVESLMEATRYSARHLTGADGVTLVIRAGDQCYYADEDAIAPLFKGQRFPLQACVSGWVMEHRQSVVIPDVYADPRVPHDVYRATFVKSMIMVPVRRDDPIAAIGAYWKSTDVPSGQHLRLVELIADAAAVSLASGQTWNRVRDWLGIRDAH